MDGRAWQAAVHGVAEGQTRLKDFTFTFHFHALEKEMATHSSVLAWRIPGTGEPGGLPSMGSHRVRHDWSDSAAAAASSWETENQEIKESHCGWWSKNKRKFWWNNPRGECRNHIMRYLYDRLYRFWIVFHMLKDKLRHSKMFQFSSVAQSCPTLCDPMNRSTPGLPVHHQLPEFIQTHVHQVSDAIQTSHPLSSPSPPAPNPSQHQSLFQWVNS